MRQFSLLVVALTSLVATETLAQELVDAAARACSMVVEERVEGDNATTSYNGYDLTVDGRNSLTIRRQGQLVSRVTDFSFQSYTQCLQDLVRILNGLPTRAVEQQEREAAENAFPIGEFSGRLTDGDGVSRAIRLRIDNLDEFADNVGSVQWQGASTCQLKLKYVGSSDAGFIFSGTGGYKGACRSSGYDLRFVLSNGDGQIMLDITRRGEPRYSNIPLQ